jgi:hypothetical protein
VGSMRRWLAVGGESPGDVDVLVPADHSALKSLLAALEAVGARPRRGHRTLALHPEASPQQFDTPLGPLDVFVVPWERWRRDFVGRARLVEVERGFVRIPAPDPAAAGSEVA